MSGNSSQAYDGVDPQVRPPLRELPLTYHGLYFCTREAEKSCIIMSLKSLHFSFCSRAPRSFPIVGKVLAGHDDSLWGLLRSSVDGGSCAANGRMIMGQCSMNSQIRRRRIEKTRTRLLSMSGGCIGIGFACLE